MTSSSLTDKVGPVVLCLVALIYVCAALWPQAVGQVFPGYVHMRGHWLFWFTAVSVWLSVPWLLFAPKTAGQLKTYQGLCLVVAFAVMFVSLTLGCALMLLGIYAGRPTNLTPKDESPPKS